MRITLTVEMALDIEGVLPRDLEYIIHNVVMDSIPIEIYKFPDCCVLLDSIAVGTESIQNA